MKRIEYLLYLELLRTLVKRAVMTKSSKNSESTLKMTAIINYLSWQLWSRYGGGEKNKETRRDAKML